MSNFATRKHGKGSKADDLDINKKEEMDPLAKEGPLNGAGEGLKDFARSAGNTIRDASRNIAQSVTENMGSGLGSMSDLTRDKGETIRPDMDRDNSKVGSFAPDMETTQSKSDQDFESTGREKPDLRASAREESRQRSYPQPGNTTTVGVEESIREDSKNSKGETESEKKTTPADMRRTIGMASTTTQTKETSTPLDYKDREREEVTLKENQDILRGGVFQNEFDKQKKKEFMKEKSEAVSQGDDAVELADSWDWKILESNSKPVIVDFYKSYDLECKRLHSQLMDKFKEQSDWVLAGADVDKLQDLAKKMQISSVPTFILMHEGRILETVVGDKDLDKIIEKATDLGKQNYGPVS